jgi:hypothetical protein
MARHHQPSRHAKPRALSTAFACIGVAARIDIDRSGQPLAQSASSPAPDRVSMGALAAGAFSATAALARLPTVGMVRLFARETSASFGVIHEETRSRPRRTGALAAPLTADEAGRAVEHRPG